jgi:phosphatidylglycerol---prolipoprotein diacylglyceryl transferase
VGQPVRVRFSPFAQFYMIYILHNWEPSRIIFSLGSLNFYWYGLIISLAILLGYLTILKLANYFNLRKKDLEDLSIYLILIALAGARVYDILLEWNYYWHNPLQAFKVWEGGLAIHGAIIAGLIFIYLFSKKRNINFWKLAGIITPGLALGQAIGRFGNWFNQELFGLPTNLPWGIPISLNNRPWQFINEEYFHPTFLYESLGNLIIFFVLIFTIYQLRNRLNKEILSKLMLSLYLFFYSVLRFLNEFIRIDSTPEFLGLRWPQFFSLLIIFLTLLLIIKTIKDQVKLTKKLK